MQLILAVILFIQMPVKCVKVRVNWGGWLQEETNSGHSLVIAGR